jgi:hypothetical protein
MRTTKIEFRTVGLVVEGTYSAEDRGYSYDGNMEGQPLVSSKFEIDSIKTVDSEVNLFELFSFADIEEIENLCLINIEE